MEGLGSRAWKTARLPGVSLPKPGAPHTCRSSPCMVNRYERQLWLCCRRGSCLGLMGEGGPSLACLDVGSLVQGLPGSPPFLGASRGLVDGQSWSRQTSLPTMVSTPICCLLEAPFFPHCRPICEPSLRGNWDAGLVGPSWGLPAIQTGLLPVFSPLDTRTASSCSSFAHPQRRSCMHGPAPSLYHPALPLLWT